MVRYCTEPFMVKDHQVLQVFEELENLAFWIGGFRPHNVLEIGTTGVSFFILSRLSTGRKACVDIRDMRAKVHAFMYGEDWRFFLGNSHNPGIFAAVKAFCPSFDLIFIDGDHRYVGVKRDFELYSRLLSERGAVLFHDVDPEHKFKDGLGGQVRRFWDELEGGSKTVLYTTRSSGRIQCRGHGERFGGIGIWKPSRP
jgi:predicted O-methyltransferase YrrM